eukprot:CAMPEP_0114590118 /NCGR_PEP_ID=MMETSP0125-20121206/12426_1 /TAXON_ID=485358 ORGANISM="Aristerostoma sp., Strain ATCC 50986" /NCGR_SAMPLE_ID=MMETSP0125 /ASSEMBLY_ACC=CAM_ASM_000245 /LENGTH=30 /DNA_ID= /DNA_START= /DNA_END= /DNA_ORIENTATION=
MTYGSGYAAGVLDSETFTWGDIKVENQIFA